MRIGLLVNSFSMTTFYKELIGKLQEIENVELCYIILKNQNKGKAKTGGIYSQLPIQAYLKLERKITRVKKYPLQFTSIKDIEEKDFIEVENIGKGPYSKLSESDLQKVEAMNCDMLFRIGWGIISGGILDLTKYGIWSLHHGDNNIYRGKPALFWEYYNKTQIAGCILQKLTATLDGGQVIDKLQTNVNKYYMTLGYHTLYYKSLQMVLDNVKKTERLGKIDFNTSKFDKNYLYDGKLFKNPNVFEQSKLVFSLLTNNILRVMSFKKKTWYVLISKAKKKSLLYQYKAIDNEPGMFSADPFLFEKDGNSYVFFEEAPIKSAIGHISYINCEKPTDRGIALKEDFHLSFPNIFQHENEIYMLPETRKGGEIRLYRCNSFPSQWEFHSTLIPNVSATDNEIIHHNGIYYLFTCINENSYLTDSGVLHLYYSDSLSGEYLPHPQNPISKDAGAARMAGKIIKSDSGKLLRVSQNQSNGYGSGINFIEIKELTTEKYEEELTQTVSPEFAKAAGIHTYNESANFATIDLFK